MEAENLNSHTRVAHHCSVRNKEKDKNYTEIENY